MSIALYRRYRPDTFQDVIGQDHVVKPLMAALRSGRISHAYLFSGPRGCGKTTSARIMARCLNCAEGPTDTPCGKCESCKDLATGGSGSLDVVEIDAASHNGVDDARELRERAGFAPVRDRFKIFILDEAHMVTQQGFNALLKIVEEPPEHVKFIFATTEPDKVIGTIRSRTHHYPFRLVPPEIMEKYMAKLCEAENIEPAPGVLQLVMRAGAGSVRDSLSVLDQLMAGAEGGKLEYGTAAALLGYTDSSILERSVDAIIDRDGAALFEVIAKMVEGGHEPRRYLEDLLLRLRDLLVLSVSTPEDAQAALAGTPEDQLAAMNAQAQRWGTAGISHASDLTNTALTELTGATAPRLQVELLAARLLLPEQSPAVAGEPSSTPSGLSGAEAAMAALHRPGQKRPQNTANAIPGSTAPAAPRTPEAPAEPAPAVPRANAAPAAPRGGNEAPELAAPRPQMTDSKPSAPTVDKQENQQEPAPRNEVAEQESSPKEAAASSSLREVPEVEKGEQYWQILQSWGKVSARLRHTDQRLWSTCNRHLQLGGAQNQQVTLLADTPQTVEYLEKQLAPIEKCLQEELSDSWTVQVLAGSDDSRAPAMSEVLSRIKLDASSGEEKTLPQEAPPEEEEYPPEGADPADGSEEISYPEPVSGEANPASVPSTSADAANAIAETAGETPKAADKPGDKPGQEREPASLNGDWIIANPTASESVSKENDQGAEDAAHPVASEPAPPFAAAPSPFGAPAAEMAAPRPEASVSPAPGRDNAVMAAPRDFAEELVAPRADQSAAPFEATASTPLAAPREQTFEPDIPAAPRGPAATGVDAESASPAPGAPPSYEDEDIPDLSDPDVSLDESGGRWGVEVAKSLLGGKIIETVDNSGGSGKAGI
ncbi:MAG: DNA polymerase III subunit gamma and tau [Varibaculum cambriense]|uniref:DNA polymerase III subunit gamma and tau n=1 Tax=Varibaculum cambriense TaxID=184870 RepID=UPI002915A9B4|nr:DNA polymerase III subunit gamma and tau [Varibaculum cambriense]MDU6681614.1 DNA polymerase III subunit gamma and tau [Varibaculum cambriense]